MLQYKIFPQQSLIVLQGSGMVTAQDFKDIIQAYFHDEDYKNTFNGVTDLRFAEMDIAVEELYELSQYISEEKIALGTWYILVTDAVEHALATAFALDVSKAHPIHVGKSVEQASKVLGQNVEGPLSSLELNV